MRKLHIKATVSTEAIATWLEKNGNDFDSSVETNKNIVTWTGRGGMGDDPDPAVIKYAKDLIKRLKAEFPEGVKVTAEPVDEWVSVSVKIPSDTDWESNAAYVELAKALGADKKSYTNDVPAYTRYNNDTTGEPDFDITLHVLPANIGRYGRYAGGPQSALVMVGSEYYGTPLVFKTGFDIAEAVAKVEATVQKIKTTKAKGPASPDSGVRSSLHSRAREGWQDSLREAKVKNFNVSNFLEVGDKFREEPYKGTGLWEVLSVDKDKETFTWTSNPNNQRPFSYLQDLLDKKYLVWAPGGVVPMLKDSRGRLIMSSKGSTIKASASFAEVKEALDAFLKRHPEVSHDTSVNRGSIGDEILTGAIATMTYEGSGSLYDTMNYGTENKAGDSAILQDLDKTLRDLGCYYEQGHDWSLGVYPIEESSDELEGRDLLDKMAQHLKVEPDDLTVDSTEDYGGGSVMTISHGNKSYYVGSDDALEAMAKNQIEENISQDMESMKKGNGSVYYPESSYEFYADRDAVVEFVQTSIQESENERVNELSTEEKKEWLDENDGEWTAKFKPADAGDDWEPSDEEVEKAFGYGEDWVQEQVDAQAGDFNSAYSYLEGMGPVGRQLVQYGLIDETWMAEQTLNDGGISEAIGGELYEDSSLTYVEM